MHKVVDVFFVLGTRSGALKLVSYTCVQFYVLYLYKH
jgi:hypothetical protein